MGNNGHASWVDNFNILYLDKSNNICTTNIEEILIKNKSALYTDYIHQKDTTPEKTWKKEASFIGLNYFKTFIKEKVYNDNLSAQLQLINSQIEKLSLKNTEYELNFQITVPSKTKSNSLKDLLEKRSYMVKTGQLDSSIKECQITGKTQKGLIDLSYVEKWVADMCKIANEFNGILDSWTISKSQ